MPPAAPPDPPEGAGQQRAEAYELHVIYLENKAGGVFRV